MTNPYTLPDGAVHIAFSGGRTSGYMLKQIIDANNGLRDDVVVAFANTGRELPETLDFVNECSDKWGIDIAWLEYDLTPNGENTFKVVSYETASRNGEPFDLLINKYNRLPNAAQRFCTGNLKSQVARKYMKSLGYSFWYNTLGIRSDELRRVKDSDVKYIKNWFPIADAGHDKQHVSKFWKSSNFDLNLPLINNKTAKGNCDFCFLKSEASLAVMFREYPDRGKWWVNAENRTGQDFVEGRTFTSLFDFVDKQMDWIFDDDSFLCQKDGGECTG